MNEWSPNGNYSSPGTVNQTGRSLRSQWEEPEKGTKPHLNLRAVPENRNRNFQQHSMEDVPKTTLPGTNKKGTGNGISDPRFKRVILPGVQNDACVGTEVKSPKPALVPEEKESSMSKFSVWNGSEFKSNKSWVDCIKNSDQSKSKGGAELQCENLVTTKDSHFDKLQDHLEAVDKLSFSHDITVKSASKESISECTVHTRTASLVSEDFPEKFSTDITRMPSATRVKKVENWIHDHTKKPEKKHSVITVIGQMQELDPVSSALQEIDKRRKLVKELDRYAVCKKLIETDKEKEISDLIKKISYLSSDKEALLSGSNETLNTCSCSAKGCEDKIIKHSDLSNNENTLSSYNDVNTDSSMPISVSRKPSSLNKEYHSGIKYPITGKLRMLFRKMLYQRMFCVMIIMSGILCWFAFFSIQNGAYATFDLFIRKPKPITWYEKICNWLWELLRPSSIYQRTKPWSSY